MIKVVLSLFALSFSASPLFAEILAQDLRDELISFAAENSIEIQVEIEQFNDGELILAGVTFQLPEDTGISSISVPWIRLNETADGDVELTISPENTIVIPGDFSVSPAQQIDDLLSGGIDNTSPPADIIVKHLNEGFHAIISGSDDDYIVEYEAKSQKIVLASSAIESEMELAFEFEVSGVNGRTSISGADENIVFDMVATIDQINANSEMTSSTRIENAVAMDAIFSASDFKLISRLNLADTLDDASPEDQIPEGYFEFSISDVTFNNFFSDQDRDEEENIAKIVGTIGNLRTFISLSQTNLSGEAVLEKLSANVDLETTRVTDVFDVNLDELGYRFGIDMNWDKQRGDGFYRENTDNLLFSDSFWNLLDPDATIPRGPISSLADVSISMLVSPDLFDLENLEDSVQESFSSLHLKLNRYFISGLGLQFEASGQADLSFEHTGSDFDDPKISASMHIDLQGAFELVANLMELKLLESDIAFGIRTIIGMVGIREGDGDHFVSDIEVDETGDILVNGLPFEIPR